MTEASPDLRLLIEHITKALVDAPEQVAVHQVEEDEEVVLELTVSPGDLGKVIGRQGRTARALRTLLSAASSNFDREYVLDILE